MAEIVKIDSKWRITIPKKYRKNLKPNDQLLIEKIGDTIILRKFNRENLLKEINEIKLYTKGKMRKTNAEKGKSFTMKIKTHFQ